MVTETTPGKYPPATLPPREPFNPDRLAPPEQNDEEDDDNDDEDR